VDTDAEEVVGLDLEFDVVEEGLGSWEGVGFSRKTDQLMVLHAGRQSQKQGEG
jgi:hypothetical protein